MAVKEVQGKRRDPLVGHKFLVDIGTGNTVGFSKVSGLKSNIEVVKYREGHDPLTPRKLPGLQEYDDITLEQGLTQGLELEAWYQECVDAINSGNLKPDGIEDFRRTITITAFDKTGSVEFKKWIIHRAWVSELDSGELNAGSGDIMIRKAVITNEGIEAL